MAGNSDGEISEEQRQRIWWRELERRRERTRRGDRPWDRFDIWIDREDTNVRLTVLRAQGGTRGRVLDVVHSVTFDGIETEKAAAELSALSTRARQAELDEEAEWRMRRRATGAEKQARVEIQMREESDLKADEYERAQQRLLEDEAKNAQHDEKLKEAEGLIQALIAQRRRS